MSCRWERAHAARGSHCHTSSSKLPDAPDEPADERTGGSAEDAEGAEASELDPRGLGAVADVAPVEVGVVEARVEAWHRRDRLQNWGRGQHRPAAGTPILPI